MPIPSEPATGLHTPIGETHPGVCLSGADAIVFAADLAELMKYTDAPQAREAKIREGIALLRQVEQVKR